MFEWLIVIAAAVGGLLLGKIGSVSESQVSKMIIETTEKGGGDMTMTLQPLYTAFVYILVAMGAAGVIAFVVWTFMQVFGEKKAGKEV